MIKQARAGSRFIQFINSEIRPNSKDVFNYVNYVGIQIFILTLNEQRPGLGVVFTEMCSDLVIIQMTMRTPASHWSARFALPPPSGALTFGHVLQIPLLNADVDA